MDLGFSMRIRRQRRRDAAAPAELPLSFAKAAVEQAGSPTAVAQAGLDRTGTDRTPFAERVALFAGVGKACRACASFATSGAPRAASSTNVKAPFTLALQRSFNHAAVEATSSNEQPGASVPARGSHD